MTVFKIGKTYKHVRNTDVAFESKGLVRQDEKSCSYLVKWWNIVARMPYAIGDEVICIKNTDMEDWKEYNMGIAQLVEQRIPNSQV